MSTKLYYHRTDGGAEYLTDTFIPWAHNGKSGREGTITNKTRILIRLDGKPEAAIAAEYDRANLLDALKALVNCPDYRGIKTHEREAARRAIEQAEPHEWTAEEILRREG